MQGRVSQRAKKKKSLMGQFSNFFRHSTREKRKMKSKHLTTEKEINQKLHRMKEPIQSEAQVNEMIGKYPKVFQGIGCHKYRQIKLDIYS